MDKYLTYQIVLGNLKYADVIAKYITYKDSIDTELKEMGWQIDTTGNCVAITTGVA